MNTIHQIQKPTITFFLLLLTSLSSFAGEGKCELAVPTPIQKINGGMLGTIVLNSIHLVETAYRQKGEELKAVFIGRMGTDLGSSRVLSNYSPEGQFMPNLQAYRSWANQQRTYDNQDSNIGPVLEKNFSNRNRQAKYSHFGIAIKTPRNSGHPLGDNEWVVVHLLRQCRNPMANLHDEGFWPFFLDNPSDYGSQILVPKKEIQQRLVDLIFKERAAYLLMAPTYNVVAEWNDPDEQNSANWPLEMLALAQMPEGWFEKNLDAGAIDINRFLHSYGELKERQNNLVKEFASKYNETETFNNDGYNFNPGNGSEEDYDRLKTAIKNVEQQLLNGYYPLFRKARQLAQTVLKENHYLPTRFLLKGMAAMATTFFGPNYVDFHGDNGRNNLARATTLLAFREYAIRQQLIDDKVLNEIDKARSIYAQSKFEDASGPAAWEHFGLEARQSKEVKSGILDLCLLGRVKENPKKDEKPKSPSELNYCKRYSN